MPGATAGSSLYHALRPCPPVRQVLAEDCAWGRARAYPQSDGWIRSMHYYGQTYLRVWVFNDFAPSDGRADYTTDERFRR